MPEKDERTVENPSAQPGDAFPAENAPQGESPTLGAASASDVGTSSVADESAPSSASDASQAEVPPSAPKPPSKARRFVRKLWRWTLSFLVVFGLGFVVAAWVLYRPARQQAQQAQQAAQQAADEVQALQGKLQQAQSQAKSLQDQIAAMQDTVQQAQLEAAVDQALAEAYAVRLALKEGDHTGATLHAEALGKALQALAQVVPSEHAEVVKAMQSQFSEMQGKLDSPNYADRQLRAMIQHLMALKDVLGLK